MAALAMIAGCRFAAPVVEPEDSVPGLPAAGSGEDAEPQVDSSEALPTEGAPDGAEAETTVVEPELPPPPPPPVERLCQPEMVLVPPGPDTSPFLAAEHFLLDWHVLGPFSFEAGDFQREQQQDVVDFPFMADEAGLNKDVLAPAYTSWRRTMPNTLFSGKDYVCAYAVLEFSVPAVAEAVTLRVGSDDYIKIWLNGELVHTYNTERRSGDWDQDVIDGILLRQGDNRLVVKCIDIVGDWTFSLRFTDVNGMPFKGVPISPRE
jgi:hypothetical protein